MNTRIIAKFLGVVVIAVGVAMACCLPWALVDHDPASTRAFLISVAVALGLGGTLVVHGRAPVTELHRKESLAVVTLGWVVAAALGAMPYVLTDTLPKFVDAYFEAMSGFTTTGSTVLTDIEAAPRALLFWRDLTHWLGGMGIVVLFLAILPTLGVGGRHLFRSEIPGAVKEGIRPRIKETASLLWKIYVVISAAQVVLLLVAGMDLFDSLCHTFGTMATGGFSTRQASIGDYDSVAIELIVILFMILAGTNFSLYFHLLRRSPGRMLRDPEWRAFLSILAAGTVLITLDLWLAGAESVATSVREASFQVVSILTTTGYGTSDFEAWPAFSKLVLVAFMFVGACSGSTGGAMKVLRIMVVVRFARHQVQKIFEPHAVISVKLGGTVIRDDILREILAFFILFIGLFIVGSLIMTAMGLDLITATTSVAATLGNIGPGLGLVGPTNDFSGVPGTGKWVLAACMLLGRLEIYTVLALVLPRYWRS